MVHVRISLFTHTPRVTRKLYLHVCMYVRTYECMYYISLLRTKSTYIRTYICTYVYIMHMYVCMYVRTVRVLLCISVCAVLPAFTPTVLLTSPLPVFSNIILLCSYFLCTPMCSVISYARLHKYVWCYFLCTPMCSVTSYAHLSMCSATSYACPYMCCYFLYTPTCSVTSYAHLSMRGVTSCACPYMCCYSCKLELIRRWVFRILLPSCTSSNIEMGT